MHSLIKPTASCQGIYMNIFIYIRLNQRCVGGGREYHNAPVLILHWKWSAAVYWLLSIYFSWLLIKIFSQCLVRSWSKLSIPIIQIPNTQNGCAHSFMLKVTQRKSSEPQKELESGTFPILAGRTLLSHLHIATIYGAVQSVICIVPQCDNLDDDTLG